VPRALKQALGSQLESFANIERTTGGGTHVRGMLNGLARGLRAGAPQTCRGKGLAQLTRAISVGLNAVVCVRLNDPEYQSPTRDRLGNPDVEVAVRECVSEAFAEHVRGDPQLLSRLTSQLEKG